MRHRKLYPLFLLMKSKRKWQTDFIGKGYDIFGSTIMILYSIVSSF